MDLANVSLEDKYRLERGRVFVTGTQALARLPMLQHALDRKAGLHTAGYISGYRGSPLGGLDTALHAAEPFLKQHDIRFQPGLNEDIAATAIWGTQQLHLFPEPKFDGIFAMWYGKGPGVDRSGDVFRHANHAGTSKHGGVLLIAGDDPSARSSAVAHQSEHIFSACGIPVLAPSNLQEYLDYGLHGWAMSRYSGCWVAMKLTSDTAESSAVVDIEPEGYDFRIPADFPLPPDGVHLRWPDPQLAQELRLQQYKVYAAIAYARANRLNRLIYDSPRPRLGIIACGKAYMDVRQALDDLGIDGNYAAEIGLRLFKVGMPWPLEADSVRQFAEGLEEILVVEEKRQIIEYQLKEMLYNWTDENGRDVRPRIVGKYDETGEWPVPEHHWLLPPTAELTPAIVARAIAARIGRFHTSPRITDYIAFLDGKARALAKPRVTLMRTPWFCPGCPHNQSTKVPAGSCALGGVGCHLMAVTMGRNTLTISHMGGEGATWLGVAGHSGTQHVFANMGDGTYFHSGLLAIRAAVAAKVNITYKLLFNDAVAMTGGQAIDGILTVPQLTRQLAAEDVARIIVMSDEPDKYKSISDFAPGVEIRHRDTLEATQRELRETKGVSALVYDQTCAAEKRRRRKRGTFKDPAMRVFINTAVCEGCGDCAVKSNCLAVVPVETEFGRKRATDQFACNKDFSCLDGFCPSMVTVHGGSVRRGKALATGEQGFADLPDPPPQSLDHPYGILIAGVGGTGVVTIGALLGMAAHLEGKGVTVLDMTGLAQKGGAVMSHVRLAERQEQLHSARIATGEAKLILGCDIVVTVTEDALSKAAANATRAIVNTGHTITGEFLRNPDREFPAGAMEQVVVDTVGRDAAEFIDATRLATRLMGHSIATNIFMLGHAFQRGRVPLSLEAILRAIELNGAAVEDNRRAFQWGRRAAHDPAGVAALLADDGSPKPEAIATSLDEIIARRRRYLADYQDEAYAQRYLQLVDRVRAAEAKVIPGDAALTEAVARSYFKLLACKDEYEVARLYTAPEFAAELAASFEGDYHLEFHLTLPWRRGAAPGEEPKKQRFGPWMLTAMKLLAKFKFLRGTALNPFGRSAERVQERELVAEYEASVKHILDHLDATNHDAAVALARVPESIRGYGPVKERSVVAAMAKRDELMAAFDRKEARTPLAA
ncbi:MAG: indolepyruvate ferredoxin oxidoreductase family protein [Betaproteobacteria bacterium]|nr:indolepyruvate ferredoxin oxidoreductase family protein [Betaproteobacteria bacterium]